MRMAASWSRASQPHRIQGCRRDLLRARGTAPLGSIGHHRGGGRLGMLRVKARAYARPLRGFGLDPSAFPVCVAYHHVGGDRRRLAQKSELPARLDKKRPIQGTSIPPGAAAPGRGRTGSLTSTSLRPFRRPIPRLGLANSLPHQHRHGRRRAMDPARHHRDSCLSEGARRRARVERVPVWQVLKRQPKEVALTALLRLPEQAPGYTVGSFIFFYATTVLGCS